MFFSHRLSLTGILLTKNVWDNYWSHYESEISVDYLIRKDPFYRLLKKMMPLDSRETLNVLEIGCGSGARTLALVKDFKSLLINAVLIDSSLEAIAFAKKNAKRNKIKANFILADAFNLPLTSNFDIVWNEGVNEHFWNENRQLIFQKMASVCNVRFGNRSGSKYIEPTL